MIHIYTDGSCKSSTVGPAGLGVVILSPRFAMKFGRYIGKTVSSSAELLAIEAGLDAARKIREENEAMVYSDCNQALESISGRIDAIPRHRDILNRIELLVQFFAAVKFVKIKRDSCWQHSEADKLARTAAGRKKSTKIVKESRKD